MPISWLLKFDSDHSGYCRSAEPRGAGWSRSSIELTGIANISLVEVSCSRRRFFCNLVQHADVPTPMHNLKSHLLHEHSKSIPQNDWANPVV
eukprot:3935720-Amphidinium_carterae.1